MLPRRALITLLMKYHNGSVKEELIIADRFTCIFTGSGKYGLMQSTALLLLKNRCGIYFKKCVTLLLLISPIYERNDEVTSFDDVYKYVLTLCRNDKVAEEITQVTFFKALKNIDRFKGESKLYVWLCQIAKNTYFTFHQMEKR